MESLDTRPGGEFRGGEEGAIGMRTSTGVIHTL